MEAARLVERFGAGVFALPLEVVMALRAVVIADSKNAPQSESTPPSKESALAALVASKNRHR